MAKENFYCTYILPGKAGFLLAGMVLVLGLFSFALVKLRQPHYNHE